MKYEFTRAEIERAVDLQRRGYELLKWLEKAFADGFISPEAADQYVSSEEAAFGWLDKHYDNIPERARPPREDLRAFSAYFSTYLDNSFDLTKAPGQQLYSPDPRCFCPLCSWMVNSPHLTPKKIGAGDKKVALNMKREFIRGFVTRQHGSISSDDLDALVSDPEYREAIGMCTYAADLLQRLDGIAVGAASLVLWRSFAWNTQGSPKQGFQLTADAILDAKEKLARKLLAHRSG
jgi:hypothetical protein